MNTVKPSSAIFICFFMTALTLSGADRTVPEPGLLFHLSGERGFTADVASGKAEPNFLSDVEIIPDGASGRAFRCAHTQLMSYWAPGNIYAQRGTLAFFWRPREPAGTVAFPIFRVGYSDHSSWDMVWLRIDYNGRGFDAFVTDVNLSRTRVSYALPGPPKSDRWLHLALAWDENEGIRFYVDGFPAGKKDTVAVYDAGLDQFGPHSRIISPYQVQSAYNFMRGGDIDEIRIYDRMLAPADITLLAKARAPAEIGPAFRALNDKTFRNEWWLRHGWNRPDDVPPCIKEKNIRIRKIGIHDVYDRKQWMWKGTDGIRETTWPGVYNRSRIAGRNDYFQLPDWNCYSVSGKSVTFTLPDEHWNHLEISGAAYGTFRHLANASSKESVILFDRPKLQERTFHRLDRSMRGGLLKFDDAVQETPIGELAAYCVTEGTEPHGTFRLSYTLRADVEPDYPCLASLRDYVRGRFVPDERSVVVALPDGAPRSPRKSAPQNPLPLVHILIPCDFRYQQPGGTVVNFSYTWENANAGLDGIALDLPPMNVKPTHGGLFPMNVRILDPLWPDRTLLDFSFSVRPGEAKTLWLDTRDRMLPPGYSLYMTLAGAGSDFGPASLDGARLRLVFKDRKDALPEHELDRFTQVKDNCGFIVEEHPNNTKLRLYERFQRDIGDLLRVNPDHVPGRYYWCENNPEQGWPEFTQPAAPRGVPLWAFRQAEDMRLLGQFVNWWIDNRQIENGEFGGGLSDDGDLTNQWPGPALMGIDPEKITRSVLREMGAFYENGMFTDGLSTILADELHSCEEGIQVLGQTMLLDYGNPKVVERLMETARRYPDITDVNAAGHRHICTSLFSGTRIVREGVWQWAKPASYLILQPGMALVEFNGHPGTRKLLLELADGVIAHRKKDSDVLPAEIFFPTDEGRGAGVGRAVHLFWAAWRWTGNPKYLLPLQNLADGRGWEQIGDLNANLLDLLDKRGSWGREIVSAARSASGSDFLRHAAWQLTGDKAFLEAYYADQVRAGSQRMVMMTEGHWWVDRVNTASAELQRSRLGGVALLRNRIYPGHVVSWRFEPPATGTSVAILVPESTTERFQTVAYNLETVPVRAFMTAWDIAPGTWRIKTGIDTNNDDRAEADIAEKILVLERTQNVELVFEPRKTTVIDCRLLEKAAPYWERPDLGIGPEDIKMEQGAAFVRVHSLGSVETPPSTAVLKNADGKILSEAIVPAIPAPLDLHPKTAEIKLVLPPGSALSGASICINPDGRIFEVTRRNNTVPLPRPDR